MDQKLEKKFNKLAKKDDFDEIVRLIEQIPERERDWETIGWYVLSLNNSSELEKAVEVSLQYREQGANDASWHYRLGYAYVNLNRFDEAENVLQRAKELAKDDEELKEYVDELFEQIIEKKEKAASKAKSEAYRRAAKILRNPDKEPFEGFDFSGFWDDSAFSLKEYVGAPPSNKQFAEVEKALGYKLPASYKWLMKHHNGGIPVNTCHPTDTPTSWAEDHVAITGIFGIDFSKANSLTGELGSKFMIEEWGYPDIGIAICDCPSAGHDMIFLDYRHCGPKGEPEVAHIDQENNYEITYVADDFESFIRGLVNEEEYE